MNLPLSNPVFQGGIGLMIISFAARYASAAPKKLWALSTQRLWITCTTNDDEDSFSATMRWLGLHLEEKQATAYRVHTRWMDDGSEEGGRHITELIPGPSERVLRYRGAKMWLSLGEEKEAGKRSYTLVLRCRRRHRVLLKALVDEIAELERRPDPTVTKILRPGGNRNWVTHAIRPVRAAESMVLHGTLFEDTLADMQKFADSFDWYLKLGIPYRRGYLLYGPPGNGKSSLAFALAGALGRDLYVLPLGDPMMSDERLVSLMGSIPSRALVAMEDIDTVFHARERKADNKLTLSGLLNVLDGPLATEGRVVVMTTNHPEVLDPALIRPGRIDVRMELANATCLQAHRLLSRFYPDATIPDLMAFNWAGDGRHSMAGLQAHLVQTIGDLDAALAVQEPVAMTIQEMPRMDDDDDAPDPVERSNHHPVRALRGRTR